MSDRKIEHTFSIYLDLIRFLAAIIVVLSHVWALVFPAFPLPWPGHVAVIVFFVLSGYVIAHTAEQPEANLVTFTSHRAVRILSVTIPALLLSILAARSAGTMQIPHAGTMVMSSPDFWRAILLNFAFLGQSWSNNLPPPYNPPYWSLCYEVWYYIVFACYRFSPSRFRLPAAALATALAGPKIILLMPVWLMGVAIYHFPPQFSPRTMRSIFWLTLISGFLFFWFDVSRNIYDYLAVTWPLIMRQLHASNQFIGDYLLGLLVASHFLAASSVAKEVSVPSRWTAGVRFAASFTLSTYLFHMPLTVMIWNGMGFQKPGIFFSCLVAGVVLLGCITERRNHFFRGLLSRFCSIAHKPLPISRP